VRVLIQRAESVVAQSHHIFLLRGSRFWCSLCSRFVILTGGHRGVERLSQPTSNEHGSEMPSSNLTRSLTHRTSSERLFVAPTVAIRRALRLVETALFVPPIGDLQPAHSLALITRSQ
jgi:hypothetical protein